MATCGISNPFGLLSPTFGQVAYVLRDRSPLTPSRRKVPVRLAFLRHAASVRPEPGSNSPTKIKLPAAQGHRQDFSKFWLQTLLQGPAITNLAALLDLEVTQKTNRQTFAHSVTLFGCQGARTPPLCLCLVAGVCSRSSNWCGAHSLMAFALARQRHPSLYPTAVSLSRPAVKKSHRFYEVSDQEPTDKPQREGCAALLSIGLRSLESNPARSLTSTSRSISRGPSGGGKVNIP